MKVNTKELIGVALDYAVALAEGYPNISGIHPQGRTKIISGQYFSPSTDWAHGGPIIARMSISDGFNLEERPETLPLAQTYYDQMSGGYRYHASGPTPLIAAMRCYVVSKLGDTVELPEQLLSQ